jgi:predicted cupin superfamily sugar epimerase
VWNFYLGGPMTVVEISDEGVLKETILLGKNVLGNDEVVQYVVKKYITTAGL